MYLRDCFALKPFRDYSLCSVCILPQPAFYSESAVCILHSVCILPLVRSLQSAVRSLRFTLTDNYSLTISTQECRINTRKFNTKGTYPFQNFKSQHPPTQTWFELNYNWTASTNKNKLSLELQISYGFRQLVNTEIENRPSSHLTKHNSPARGKKNLVRQKTSLGTCIPFDKRF